MTDYVKSTNFASKDSLATGNPLKIVKGTEIDTEFNNIATAVATKADIVSPTFTGTPAAPTASAGTNTTQIATTAFVTTADNLKVDKTTTITAGTGLSGGGDLSANRTISLANTAVTAGSYGSSSAIPVITVNAQGQLTAASTASIAVPTVIADGEYATNTEQSFAVSGTRPILLSMFYSGGQSGNVYVYGQFQWGLGTLSNSRVFVDGGTNYQVAWSPGLTVTVTPSGSTTLKVKVNTTNLDGGYGAPSTFHVTIVQL